MQLIDNYMNELSRFLPTENRDDILVELRTSIEEQVADHAREQGHEPDIDDEKSVLRRFGHPLKVASEYQTQRYLIGPALFPGFVYTLKIILVVVLSLQLVVSVILTLSAGSTFSFSGLLSHMIDTAFLVAAILVAVFASMEFTGERLKWYDSWQPESLGFKSVSISKRDNVISNLITEGIFLLWWNDVLSFQRLLPNPSGDVVVTMSDAWAQLYWPLNIVFAFSFALHAYVLIRGLWHRHTLIAEIVLAFAMIGAVIFLLVSDTLINVTGNVEPELVKLLQGTASIVLLFIAGFALWDVVVALRRLRGQSV